jgi:membrane protease YdiL (CAAX protease family)
MMVDFVVSAILNAFVLAGTPLLVYLVYHRRRHGRSAAEILDRAGLKRGELRYVGYCAALSALGLAAFLLSQPPIEELAREGSAWRPFLGVGLGTKGILMSLVYGILKTGFPEELLFRGLIAGSLSRRFSLPWANLLQALVFLASHLFVLFLMPEQWMFLLWVFLGSLFLGWARIRSGSILGPWLTHACLNVTTGMYVAGASVPPAP